MKIETLGEILNWTNSFHRQLSNMLVGCKNMDESERLKLLLNYLSQHTILLSDYIEEVLRSSKSSILNTRCREYTKKYPMLTPEVGSYDLSKNEINEIEEVILKRHDSVIDLYCYLYAQNNAISESRILRSLIDLEKSEVMVMANHG